MERKEERSSTYIGNIFKLTMNSLEIDLSFLSLTGQNAADFAIIKNHTKKPDCVDPRKQNAQIKRMNWIWLMICTAYKIYNN